MGKIKIFIASSSELERDRIEFERFINRKNNELVDIGVFLSLVMWEDFLDAMSKTRLQDEYNKAIKECDVFVMLFNTKVGKFTAEEFEIAFGQFKDTGKPLIFTYFNDTLETNRVSDLCKEDIMSLWSFQEKLKNLGHFQSIYTNIDELKHKFNAQLEKMLKQGLINTQTQQTIHGVENININRQINMGPYSTYNEN